MQVILLGTPITYTMIGLNNVMRATGYPKKAMLTSMVTVVANIILAPIFIFHFEWGMRGSGYSNGYLTADRNGMGGEPLLQERQYGAF